MINFVFIWFFLIFLIILNSMFGFPPSNRLQPPLHYFTQSIAFFGMTPEAEKFNFCSAMLFFFAALGVYATTDQIIPGFV